MEAMVVLRVSVPVEFKEGSLVTDEVVAIAVKQMEEALDQWEGATVLDGDYAGRRVYLDE